MEEKAKMNWSFLRFKFKNRDKTNTTTTNASKAKHEQEQPMRQVYANARAGDKVSFWSNSYSIKWSY